MTTLAAAHAAGTAVAEDAPRTIVVGWDGSAQAGDALELAGLLARLVRGSATVATVVVDRLGVLQRSARDDALLREAEQRLDRVRSGRVLGMKVATRALVSSSPAHGLHDLAEELSAAMIVLGSTHRGSFGRVFPGSVADDLLHGAPCAVAVAPRGYGTRYANRLLRVVAVAFDVTPESEAAVAAAAELARAARARLQVLAVLQPPVPPVGPDAGYAYGDILEAEEAHLNREVARIVESIEGEIDCEGRVVVQGDPALTLTKETSEGVDLLVMGSRGYGPLGRVLLGGVSSKLIRTAACPVIVVPRRVA
jgi:nucleotide-binding universal stress UspA family protein